MTQHEIITALEPLVDASDLETVVLALARMCNEKAEHVLTIWQDKDLARVWDRNARQLDQVTQRLLATS